MRWYKTSKWIQIIFMLLLGAFVVTPLVWVIFQSLENTVARKMYTSIGFEEIKEIEYTFLGMQFREMQMVKEL